MPCSFYRVVFYFVFQSLYNLAYMVEHNLYSFVFQALYNLAYMVEHNLALKGVNWKNVHKEDNLQGNLTFAASLYRK